MLGHGPLHAAAPRSLQCSAILRLHGRHASLRRGPPSSPRDDPYRRSHRILHMFNVTMRYVISCRHCPVVRSFVQTRPNGPGGLARGCEEAQPLASGRHISRFIVVVSRLQTPSNHCAGQAPGQRWSTPVSTQPPAKQCMGALTMYPVTQLLNHCTHACSTVNSARAYAC
jgi:hypothetical protein